jgi:tetratricopeptide (TPR) repeat protein
MSFKRPHIRPVISVLLTNPISFPMSEIRAICHPGRHLISRYSSVVGITLLISLVAVGIIEPSVKHIESAVDAEFYLKRGEDYSGVQQYDRAIADYTTALELKPDYAEAYNDRGFAYYLKRDFDRAIADYTRAIELRPNYPKAYNSRGVVYMAGGYGEAKSLPDFDRAIELKPDFRYAYINRANARLFSHPRLALQDFHRAGMHPERTVAILASVAMVAIAVVRVVLRRRRNRTVAASKVG